MPKFRTKKAEVEAHVVSADEKTLQAPTSDGVEQLREGDALVTIGSHSGRVPAWLFRELFESEPAPAPGG